MSEKVGARPSMRWWLGAILLASVALRLTLVFSGGQFYWPDEGRFEVSRQVVRWFVTGTAGDLFDRLNTADHVLFKGIGVVPAALEWMAGPSWRIPGVFFSLFSSLNIWLLWRIARRLQASEREALIAAGLLAATASGLYYARHVLPYDLAITFALLAMFVGVKAPSGPLRSLACGTLAGLAFLTYAGSWTCGAAALAVHVVVLPGTLGTRVQRVVAAGLGLAAPIVAAVSVSAAFGGRLLESFIGFAGTVNQGAFAEGWRLPFAYLWYADHALLILWLACVATALWGVGRRQTTARAHAGLLALAVIYGAFVIGSVGTGRFVVYGRLARQLVPFFCLVAAHELARCGVLVARKRPSWTVAFAAMILLQAGVNAWQPLRQWFPIEFRRAYAPLVSDRPREDVTWVYAESFFPGPPPMRLPARFVVLAAASHPLQYTPYQYEGYAPQEREVLRTTDIRMRLVAADLSANR